MGHTGQLTVLLDANVLYPAPLRDFLLRLAETNLYKPKWSAQIQEEWIRNLLQNRPDLERATLEKTRAAMNAAFPDADVHGYENLIRRFELPDADDRHVLAAAVFGKAHIIITCNTKDFPGKHLANYGLKVQHPDEFVSGLIRLDETKCQQALTSQVKSLKHPPVTREAVLENLKRCGLTKSVESLRVRLG